MTRATALQGTRLTYYARPDYNQCSADCANNPNCKGHTWIQAGTFNAGEAAMCYLMSAVTGRAPARGHYSVVKGTVAAGGGTLGAREDNTSLEGTRLTFYARPDYNQCSADCANNPNCQGHTWIQAGTFNPNEAAMCYLMSTVTKRVPGQRGHYSAVKGAVAGGTASGTIGGAVGGTGGPAGGTGNLPANFSAAEWTYSIDGYSEKQSFTADGVAHGSVTGKWAVEGRELVVRWSHGWVMRYQLPGAPGKLTGTATRPDGTTRTASWLER